MDDINALIKEYIEDCRHRKRLDIKTIRAYKTDLKQFIEWIELDILDYEKIKDYIYYLNQSYTKHKTVKRKIASIKGFYSYLEYLDLITISPFLKIRTKLKEPKLLPKVIEANVIHELFGYLYEEIKKTKSKYKEQNTTRNAAIFELLFSTGLRISELCNIKKDDLDLQSGSLRIFGKGSKERILYIGNVNVITILQRYYDLNVANISRSQYFFLNKEGGRLSDQSVRKMLNDIEHKLKLTHHITPHMFRHTFASMLLDKDVDIRYIQKILGHSSIAVTQIYTHVSNVKQKKILTDKNPRNDYLNYLD